MSLSPNNSYLRSTQRERQRVNYWKDQGFHAARTAGSHGEYDLYAVSPDLKLVIFEQIKTSKGGRSVVTKAFRETREAIVRSYTLSYENKRKARSRRKRVQQRPIKNAGSYRQNLPSLGPRPDNNFS